VHQPVLFAILHTSTNLVTASSTVQVFPIAPTVPTILALLPTLALPVMTPSFKSPAKVNSANQYAEMVLLFLVWRDVTIATLILVTGVPTFAPLNPASTALTVAISTQIAL